MGKISKFIDNPFIGFRQPKVQDAMRWLSDSVYLKLVYRARLGAPLDLRNPKTFNEKLQWLKIHDRNPLYTKLVDKAEVKPWVAERIGWEHIVPTLGVWDSFDEIDFDALPDRFVLKCTHDSGGLAICRDKATFDIEEARKKIEKSLAVNYYWRTREWPYKDVKPRILAEKYLDPSAPDGDLYDYKLFRFSNGRLVTLAMTDRFTDGVLSKTFFDEDWHELPLNEGGHPTRGELTKPELFEKMKAVANKLGQDFPFVRVDFYESNGGLYFGEMTFYPNSGFEHFDPGEWDTTFGSWIDLTEVAGGGWLLVSDAFALWLHGDASYEHRVDAGGDLTDYKVMCFGGKALCEFTCTGRADGDLRVDFFDTEWNHMPFTRHYPNADVPPEAPARLKDMIAMAERLAGGIPFVRADFYEIAGELYFGEMTFYPGSGMEEFEPECWDAQLGSWIELPESIGGVAPRE